MLSCTRIELIFNFAHANPCKLPYVLYFSSNPVREEPTPPLPDTNPLEPDVGFSFDGLETIPDYPSVGNAIEELAQDIIGDIIPEEILFEDGNIVTQDKVQVHLTIGGSAKLS